MNISLYLSTLNDNNRFPKVTINGEDYYVESSYRQSDDLWYDILQIDPTISNFLKEYDFPGFEPSISREVIIDDLISEELMLYINLKYPDSIDKVSLLISE